MPLRPLFDASLPWYILYYKKHFMNVSDNKKKEPPMRRCPLLSTTPRPCDIVSQTPNTPVFPPSPSLPTESQTRLEWTGEKKRSHTDKKKKREMSCLRKEYAKPNIMCLDGTTVPYTCVTFLLRLKHRIVRRAEARSAAALLLQRRTRGMLARRSHAGRLRARAVLTAVLRLQSWYRGVAGRGMISALRKQRAPYLIQGWYRRTRVQRERAHVFRLLRVAHTKAAKVQALWKGYHYRTHVQERLFKILKRAKFRGEERELRRRMHLLLQERMRPFLPSPGDLLHSDLSHIDALDHWHDEGETAAAAAAAAAAAQEADESGEAGCGGGAAASLRDAQRQCRSWGATRRLDALASPACGGADSDSDAATIEDVSRVVQSEYAKVLTKPVVIPSADVSVSSGPWRIPVKQSLFAASKAAIEATRSPADCENIGDWRSGLRRYDAPPLRPVRRQRAPTRKMEAIAASRGSGGGEPLSRMSLGRHSLSPRGTLAPGVRSHAQTEHDAASITSSMLEKYYGDEQSEEERPPPLPVAYTQGLGASVVAAAAQRAAAGQTGRQQPSAFAARGGAVTGAEANMIVGAQRHGDEADGGAEVSGSLLGALHPAPQTGRLMRVHTTGWGVVAAPAELGAVVQGGVPLCDVSVQVAGGGGGGGDCNGLSPASGLPPRHAADEVFARLHAQRTRRVRGRVDGEELRGQGEMVQRGAARRPQWVS